MEKGKEGREVGMGGRDEWKERKGGKGSEGKGGKEGGREGGREGKREGGMRGVGRK